MKAARKRAADAPRPGRSAGGQKSSSTAESLSARKAAAAEARQERHAVVVVHGMGEQKPLETLRRFVEAVWGARPTPKATPSFDDIWLVPDTRAGLSELARITTRDREGARIDFFELYWSDLLVGNTFTQIRAWVTGLLIRWPHQVPRESFSLWIALWGLVALIVGLAAFVGLSTSFQSLIDLLMDAETVHNRYTAIASILLTVFLYFFFFWRLRGNLADWHKPDGVFIGIWSTITPRDASGSVSLSGLLAFAIPPAIGAAAYCWFPWMVLCALKTWALVLAGLIAFALKYWVLPVFGDVARYVRNSPDAVAAREAIRDRGIALLRALHGPTREEIAAKGYEPGDESRYDRIVVVGHSLGSVVAYDILRLFWVERGPTRRNTASRGALAALRALDAFCRNASPMADRFNLMRFRELQKDVADALANERDGWRVSDFVTLGSPLTHAEFLISRDRSAFEERKAERMFPTCPPMMEPGAKPSFLYAKDTLAHHAAMFSATRWTNIYDPPKWLLAGDFISGPCVPNFGPGVMDIPVAINSGRGLSRLLTHTQYWGLEASALIADAEGAKLGLKNLSADRKGHITLLRAVMKLRGREQQQP